MLSTAASNLPSDTDLAACILASGIATVITVPCSVTAGLHSQLTDLHHEGRLELVTTTHEANLVGLAAGVWFGTGRPALIHLQNSGLPNVGDGIISFGHPRIFGIPLAVLVTYRGATEAEESEPHRAIGARTDGLVEHICGPEALIAGDRHGLDRVVPAFERVLRNAVDGGLGVLKLSPHAFRPSAAAPQNPPLDPGRDPAELIEALWRRQQRGWPATLAHRGSGGAAPAGGFGSRERLDRDAAIAAIRAGHPGAVVLFCNGFTARAAQARGDRVSDFFNVGYMGGTLAIGWALARCRPDLEVVVVDGDQNAQMSAMKDHLLQHYPANLHWYILNNGVGASVGGPRSLPLSPLYHALARVVPTRPDDVPFPHPRVGLGGQHGPRPTLAPLAQRLRRWIADQPGSAVD